MEKGSTAEKASERVKHLADSKQDSDEEASESERDINTDEEDEYVLPSESESSDDSVESGEDMEETADHFDQEWKSKNRQIMWSQTHGEALRDFPASRVKAGPTRYAIARTSTVKSCFDLFMTDDIMQLILRTTNLQGKRSVKDWKDIDVTDLQAYIGLLILAGVYRSRNESTRSLWDDHTGRAIFRATMSHGKFELISSRMRFDDKQKQRVCQKQDRLAPIWTIWDKWVNRLPLLFNLGQDVCVDEQLLPFKGCCGFRQYLPKKPAKYGIKIWATCDVETSYAWKMQIYTGKPAGSPPEVNQGKRVVLDMTEGLQGKTVTCDSFFTSYALAEELLKKKMTLVGAIRKNKPELPPQLLQTKQRAPRSSLFAFTKTHTLVSYIAKRRRNVLLLSTKHREPSVSNEEQRKPTMILDYNRCKGGVDNLDKVCALNDTHIGLFYQGSHTFSNTKFKAFLRTFQAQFPQIQALSMTRLF